ncbi:hypothetical protein D3C86_2196150 [compost metagenome]
MSAMPSMGLVGLSSQRRSAFLPLSGLIRAFTASVSVMSTVRSSRKPFSANSVAMTRDPA